MMDAVQHARDADRAGNYQEAADAYEAAIAAGNRAPDVLLDLAGLYWTLTDPGVAAGHHVPAPFMERAGKRLRPILDEAIQRYPDNPEVVFWKKYIGWADFGGGLRRDECLAMVHGPQAIDTPIIFLVADGIEGLEERAQRLLDLARREGTARDSYVVSVLEGHLNRAGKTQFK
jgi:hypothetical protein